MEVTYSLERIDYVRYNTFAVGRVPALRRQGLLRLVFVPAIFALDLYFLHLPPALYALAVGALLGGWIVLMRWAQRRAVVAQTEARPGALGLHTLSLHPEGVRQQSSVIGTRVAWTHLTEIAEDAHVIALFLGPRFALFVPTRAFETPASAEAFVETARAHLRSAQNGTPLALPDVPATWPPPPRRQA